MAKPGSLRSAAFAPLALGMALAGCAHLAAPPASNGQSSFEFIPPPPPPQEPGQEQHLEIPENEEYVEAKPILPLTDPLYPPAALAAHTGSASFEVRITVDAEGRVADVEPSLVSLALPIPFSQAFRDAIETAVAQWKFHPAEVIYLAPAPASGTGGTYLKVSRREKVAAIFEVVFTFSATGKVRSMPGGAPREH